MNHHLPHRPRPTWLARRASATRVAVVCTLCALAALSSCDSLIYDDEGDCSTTRLVSLTYTMNMAYADAFASHVESVSLYAFDADGLLAYQKTEEAATITAAGGVMDVSDIDSGTYTLVVWALGEEATADSYDAPTTTVGSTTIEQLTRTLVTTIETTNTGNGTTRQTVGNDLTPLLHGMTTDADLTDVSGGGTRTAEVDLTLDTNQLVVVLQHLSGAEVDVTDFTFEVSDNNALLAYDNTPSEAVTYYPWLTYTGTATTDDEEEDDDATSSAVLNRPTTTQTRSTVSVAVAEFSLNRLMADADTRLTVYNPDGTAVLSIPVVDYALLVRGYYNSSLTDQDYLDRQSTYSMTFFLDDTDDEDNVWISTSIIINGWHLILEDVDL